MRSASVFSEYSAAFRIATSERGLRYDTECFGHRQRAAAPVVAAIPAAEPMNHLSTLECQDRGGESSIVSNIVAVSDERCQSGLEMLDRLLVHEQAENAPAEALDRLDVG